mmetsp:Transcript_25945/g.62305  ORF Transcript_25945/g.62305 Transcript_25945/m.62305 type:complete len:100 (+) Transcript_25945:550-849(+)
MSPAPKKPTPDGIAADTRLESHAIGPDKNPNVELMVNNALPKLTKAMVLIPAGLSLDRLSYPIRLPKTTAINKCRPRVHSVLLKYNRNQYRVLSHCVNL